MKNIEVSSRNLIGGLVLSFLLGIGFAQTAVKALLRDHIPEGVYAPIVMTNGVSFQVNLDQIDFDGKTLTTWIREDDAAWFKTDLGTNAQTIFVKVTVDCPNKKIAMLEERAFGPRMTYIGTTKGDGVPGEPKTVTTIGTFLGICEIEVAQEKSEKHQVEQVVPETIIKAEPHYPGKHEA